MATGTREHNVNPATGRCVMCGRNEWNRQRVPNCDYEPPRSEQGSGEPTMQRYIGSDGYVHEVPAPAAAEQHVSWTSVNMTEDPRNPRFTIEEGDKLLATAYDAATAAQIITEHNQHSTLIVQRDRLFRAAQFLLAMNATNYDRDAMRSEGGFDALQKAVDEIAREARAALITSEQERGREGQR